MKIYVIKNSIYVIRNMLCAMLFWSITISLEGQTMQQGRVKTLGRPQKPGKGLSDVVINIAEVPNDIKSNHQGEFSFYPKGKKYMMSRIRKNNYQLIDQSMIGRLFPFSADVPLEIVMVSSQDLMNDKQRIEDKAYERAERNYKKKIADLELQLKQHFISSTEAEKVRIRIGENYQRYLNLIGQMSERYATTDYDGISNTNKRIMQCIEDGELELADSLLNSKGDFKQREAELLAQEQITKKAEEFANQSRKVLDLQRNDLAQDYFNKHSIMMGNYQNDSAAYYMERRSMLDTTNVEWMIEAGLFVNDYLADYGRAIRHYRHAKSIATELYGENNIAVARCDILIGKSLMEQGRYSRAMDSFFKAKVILESMPQQGLSDLADCYAQIALVYSHMEEPPYMNATKSIKRAVELVRTEYGDQSIPYANILTLKASMPPDMFDTDRLGGLYKAQQIYEAHQGNSKAAIARIHYNIGIAQSGREFEKGRESIQKALDIWKQLFGEHHPYVSYAYAALADSYMKQKEYQQADKYYNMALDNQKTIFGESHPFIADCHLKLGRLYRRQGNYGQAAHYAMKSLDVILQFDEYQERQVISLLQSIDSWLNTMKVIKHSDEELRQLYYEFGRLRQMQGSSSSKKSRLKKINI